MARRTRRKIILISMMLMLLLLLVGWYMNFRATNSLKINIAQTTDAAIPAPTYFYSMAGAPPQIMKRPLGVYSEGDAVYVADAADGKIFQLRVNGQLVRVFGDDRLTTPMYIKKNPKNGRLYVTDRRQRQMVMFSMDGRYLGVFDPKLPKDQLPKGFETKGDQWMPVAFAFAPDGTMYVTEFLAGHRLLIFDPNGKFKRSVGTAGPAARSDEDPEKFQFPNGVAVNGDEVWVTDSNNRRVQVFDREGDFKYIVPTQGLPRGVGFLARRADEATSADKLVVIDTLSHDGTIWGTNGERIVKFGTRGVLEGQFNYPNDISIGAKDRLFVSDTANGRVQVWGWPENVSPIPPIRVPQQWGWCLTPLLLLPLLLLLRKRRYVATADFVHAMIAEDAISLMPHRRRIWLVTPEDYEALKGVKADVDLATLLEPAEFSESDIRAMMEQMSIDRETASIIAIAQRSKLFCTESMDLARIARLLEIDTVDHEGFIARFSGKGKGKDKGKAA